MLAWPASCAGLSQRVLVVLLQVCTRLRGVQDLHQPVSNRQGRAMLMTTKQHDQHPGQELFYGRIISLVARCCMAFARASLVVVDCTESRFPPIACCSVAVIKMQVVHQAITMVCTCVKVRIVKPMQARSTRMAATMCAVCSFVRSHVRNCTCLQGPLHMCCQGYHGALLEL